MAYNQALANRVREALEHLPAIEEKAMFSGLAFMVNNKMCINISHDDLMLRIDPLLHDELVEKQGCREVIMKGKPMKGYVYVEDDALQSKSAFDYWINLALDYNQFAKKSQPKKRKKGL